MQREETQFSQNFSSADVRSGDGAGGGRGGDIGSYNNVNSNNTVNNNTTYHIHSGEKLLSIPRLPLQSSASLSSREGRSRLDSNSPSPSPVVNPLYASHPCFVLNEEGQALNLSNSDQKTICSSPFHAGQNQQWSLSDDGQGKFAFMCMENGQYLAFKRLEEDAALFLSITPFYWQVFTYGEKYRIDIPKLPPGVPQSNLSLSISSHVASLRSNFESHNTMLYILADTTENRAKIQALETASTAGMLIPTPPNIVHPEDDTPIDFDGLSQFVLNRQGLSLDLSGGNDRTLILWKFHGNWNQQWALERQSNGLVALRSLQYSLRYITFEQLAEDAGLFCTSDPVYWELSRDKDGFNLGVPGSHLGIGLAGLEGATAKLRPLYEHPYTRLHLLETSEATVNVIRRADSGGDLPKTLALYRGNPRPKPDAPRPSGLKPFMSRIEETCVISGFTGTVLDRSDDGTKVYGYDYNGGDNQQWLVNTDGRGGATIRSRDIPLYVTCREPELDSKLALDPAEFTWQMTKDDEGYRFSVPETNFALSLGGCGRIRYLHEQPGTCVYLMDKSAQSVALMKAKIVSSSTILLESQKLPGVYTSKDSKRRGIPNHGEESKTLPTTSEANRPPLPKYSSRLKSWKKSRNTTGGGSSSSKDCTVQ